MKRALLIILTSVVLLASYSPRAEAAAILVILDTSGGSASCNNSLAFSATNCGAGFTTVANGSSIVFTGIVGGFSMGSISVNGNQPGTTVAGNVLDAKFNVLHLSGTGNLQIDFGGNDFSLPIGPNLSLSASISGNWGQSQATDVENFQAWGRADNLLTIPGGTATAIAPSCIPGAGLTTSCSTVTTDIPFTRGAGNYSLTGRQIINQSTLDTLGASYSATVTANQVPEPTTVILFGAGLILVALGRKGWK